MPSVDLPYPECALTDGRIGIRRSMESDLECIREAGADTDIPRGTSVPGSFTPAEGIAFIHRQWSRAQDGVGVSQAIIDAQSDRAIGLVYVSLRPQPCVGGLGYWIIPSARGRGAATTAVRLITPWAFDALRLHRVEAWVHPQNLASQHVLASAGFEQEGRLRNFFCGEGGASDALVFSAIPRPANV
ncbi:MAG: GNAT family N-acetyltransferase [Nocardioidaceae bacterium]